MKLAACHAIAALAREEVPEDVKQAYNGEDFTFGRDYILPKPFDKRLLYRVSPAVAKAAIESGVAKRIITDWTAYDEELKQRMARVRLG